MTDNSSPYREEVGVQSPQRQDFRSFYEAIRVLKGRAPILTSILQFPQLKVPEVSRGFQITRGY